MKRLDRRETFDDIFDQMQKMFNQFQDFGRDLDIRSSIAVDIKEEDGNVVVSADIPGVQKEDINLKADENKLEISAESTEEIQEENEKYLRRERSSRHHRRTVRWPKEVDPETVTASYDDGVLRVEAEKEEEDENWDIEIE